MKKVLSLILAAIMAFVCVIFAFADDETVLIDGVVYSRDGTALIECTEKYSVGAVFNIPEGVRDICDGAFLSNSKISEVVLPSTLESIGTDAFRNSAVSRIDMSKCLSLKSIMNSSFFGCKSLVSADIPMSVEEIGESAFCGCVRLERVSLPEASVPPSCFVDCTSLNTAEVKTAEGGSRLYIKGKLTSGSASPTASDARSILRIAASLDVRLEYSILSADVNRDGKITAADARKVLRAAAQLEKL